MTSGSVRVLSALLALGLLASAVQGATLVIDPNESSIELTGNVAGIFPLTPQSPGSNIIAFEGTVDLDEGPPGFLTFNSAAADAQLQASPQQPLPGGGAGSAPADAGLAIGAVGVVALRDFVVSLSGVTPFTPPTFDLTALTLEVTSGTIDFAVPAFSLTGSENIAGATAAPTGGVGTFVGGVLTIPVDVSLTFDVTPEIAATVNLVGQIEAVPEPSSLALFAVACVAIPAVGYRRWQRRATSA